jgi:GNAT superfamily N-acetyltransferase
MDISFRSTGGLLIRAADDSAGATFADFYAGYDRAFTLPAEKEERAGFVECLALNRGPAFRRVCAELGPFRELVLVAEVAGQPVGGANVFAAPLPEHGVVAINLNYVYVLPGRRGRGLLRGLVAAGRELVEWLFPGPAPVIFLELNDPLLLSAQQYAADTAAAGVDQFDRVVIWSRLGVRIIDVDYVQPPLSPAQPADDSLMLGVLAEPGFRLGGALLAEHLRRFFAVSVLKTGDLTGNESAAAQVRAARARPEIALLDPAPELDRLRGQVGRPGGGFRERLAALL